MDAVIVDPCLTDLGKSLLEAARHGDEAEVGELLTQGASFTTDWLGTTALHLSAQNGHLNTALLLMRAGMSWDARTKVNKTPLHLATQFGHFELVEAFIKQGADVNAKDILKMTPLHWAAAKNCPDIASILVKNGADLTLENKFDKTVMDICIEKSHTELLNLLKENGNDDGKSGPLATSMSDAEANYGFTEPRKTCAIPTAFLASLSALANISNDSSNSTVTLDDLALLQAGSLSMQSNSLENIRSVILTDAGRLAMQFWNKESDDQSAFSNNTNDKNVHDIEKVQCRVSDTGSQKVDMTHLQSKDITGKKSEQISTTEMERREVSTTADSTCLASDVQVSELFATPSSVQNMPFLPAFLDCTKPGESEDGCPLDLERDIFPRQLEDARNNATSAPDDET